MEDVAADIARLAPGLSNQPMTSLENRICNHFNLKISKLGGILSTLNVFELAQQHGVPCQLGSHFGESSLLSSAGALLAAKVEGKLTSCEGALGELLLAKDITSPGIQVVKDGTLCLAHLWQKPGLVDEVLPERLELFTVYG